MRELHAGNFHLYDQNEDPRNSTYTCKEFVLGTEASSAQLYKTATWQTKKLDKESTMNEFYEPLKTTKFLRSTS